MFRPLSLLYIAFHCYTSEAWVYVFGYHVFVEEVLYFLFKSKTTFLSPSVKHILKQLHTFSAVTSLKIQKSYFFKIISRTMCYDYKVSHDNNFCK